MRSPKFEQPRVFTTHANELQLSGLALVELMKAILARGVPFRSCARGWSMAPFIRDGDVITVVPLQRIPPGIGDIVAFIRPGTGNLVVHRVVGSRGANVYMRGDGTSARSDGFVPQENLLGKVVRIERNGKEVRLGLGIERYLIAWLSRVIMLLPIRCIPRDLRKHSS